MTAEDFVDVQLTAAGTAAAGEGDGARVRVAGVDYIYEFRPGKSQRITAREYSARLSSVRMNDQPIFEIAEAAEPAAGSGN